MPWEWANFAHIETYGLESPGKKTDIRGIVDEGLRRGDPARKFPHVSRPGQPVILYGNAEDLANLPAEIRKDKRDWEKKTGRKMLDNAQLLAAPVFGYPRTIEDLLKYPELQPHYLAWIESRIAMALETYTGVGTAKLVGILLHEDEDGKKPKRKKDRKKEWGHPHIHVWAKAVEIDGKLSIGNAHPGLVADAIAHQAANLGLCYATARKKSYCGAMEEWQDRDHEYVKDLGLARLSESPKPRLTLRVSGVKKRKTEQAYEQQEEKERQREEQIQRLREDRRVLVPKKPAPRI